MTGSLIFLNFISLAPPGPGEDAGNRACFSCGYTLHIHAHTACLRTETRNLRAVQSEDWPPPRAPGSQEVPGGFPTFRDCLCTEADRLQHLPTGRKSHEKNCMVLYQGHEFLSPVPRLGHLSGPTPCRALWVLHRLQVLAGKREGGLPTQEAPSVPAARSHTPWSDRARAVGARALR